MATCNPIDIVLVLKYNEAESITPSTINPCAWMFLASLDPASSVTPVILTIVYLVITLPASLRHNIIVIQDCLII